MSEIMIEARKLTKQYGPTRAIDGVSFDVHRGEVLGFLGPNGAGKTTTMKILTCYMAASEGEAKVNGYDVFENSLEVRRALGYLPEHNPLYADMVVVEYLQFIGKMRDLRGEEGSKAIKQVVEQTGLGDVLGKQIRTLSRGYKQRVGLAQALVHQPPIMILDEPLSGLDPNQASGIRELIKEIGRERTVILSTHNLAEVTVTCDRVLIIAKGKIVADDKTQALMKTAGRTKFSVSVLHDGQEGKAQSAFEMIPGTNRVEKTATESGESRFEIIPSGDGDLRPELFKAAASSGFVLTELRREGQNLEQVFRELTTVEGGAQASDNSSKEQPIAAAS